MWIDATVAASFVTNPKDSTVADKVSFALAPDNGMGVRSNWLWAWALAVPAGTQKEAAAKQFIEWATSNGYSKQIVWIDSKEYRSHKIEFYDRPVISSDPLASAFN